MGVVRPWIVAWLRHWSTLYADRTVKDEDLLLCWHFGLIEAFRCVKYDLVATTTTHDGKAWRLGDGAVANFIGIEDETVGELFSDLFVTVLILTQTSIDLPVSLSPS